MANLKFILHWLAKMFWLIFAVYNNHIPTKYEAPLVLTGNTPMREKSQVP